MNDLPHCYATTIAELASTLYGWNWLDTTGGSFSVRDTQTKGESFWLTPTHSGFRRWDILRDGLIHLDFNLNRKLDSSTEYLGHPSALVHKLIYEHFPLANAAIHTHSPNSLVFACARRPIKPFTLHSQILGVVPCFESDVDNIADRHISHGTLPEIHKHGGTIGREYMYKHFEDLGEQLRQFSIERSGELAGHGLAFTIYKHGIFVLARTIDEAFDNLIRVERNAQIQLLSKQL